jgi:hypothetical protein
MAFGPLGRIVDLVLQDGSLFERGLFGIHHLGR